MSDPQPLTDCVRKKIKARTTHIVILLVPKEKRLNGYVMGTELYRIDLKVNVRQDNPYCEMINNVH